MLYPKPPISYRNTRTARRSRLIGAHRLRHFFATNYLVAGGNLKALHLMMGHASIETTEVYAKLTQEMVLEGARKAIGWHPNV